MKKKSKEPAQEIKDSEALKVGIEKILNSTINQLTYINSARGILGQPGSNDFISFLHIDIALDDVLACHARQKGILVQAKKYLKVEFAKDKARERAKRSKK